MNILVAVLLLASQIVVDPPKPKDDLTRREAYAHYVRGQEYLTSERFAQAADEFQSATKLDNLFTDAYFGLGHAYMNMQRYGSAAQAYQRCLDAAQTIFGMRERDRTKTDQLIGDQLKAMREALAQTTKMPAGQRNAVLGIESRIRELERNKSSLPGPFEPPAQVLLSLGSAHFRNGSPDAARHYWEQAVKSDSKLGEAWNNLAVIYMREGRRSDAEAAVQHAERNGFRVNPNLKADIKNLTTKDTKP